MQENAIVVIRNEYMAEDPQEDFGFEFFTNSYGFSELTISLIEMEISNKNVKILAALAKAVHSCKNILKRGKKR